MLLVVDALWDGTLLLKSRHDTSVRGWAGKDLNLGGERDQVKIAEEGERKLQKATKQTSDRWLKNNAVQVAIAKLRRRGSRKVDEARGRSLSRWCLGKGAEWRTGSRTFLFFFGRMLSGQPGRKGGLRRVGSVGGRGVPRRRKKDREVREEKRSGSAWEWMPGGA